jgi:uncharacterized protein YjeT (DUF2065 family)
MNIAKSIFDRVIKSYKSTLVGLAFGIGILVLEGLTDYLNGLPQGWAKAAAAVIVVIGASLRSKALPPPTPAP